MSKKVLEIRAVGTSGKVLGKLFLAVPSKGKYVLHSEDLAARTGKPLRFAVNQVLVNTLDEAVELLGKGGYHIRMYNQEYKQRNLRAASEIEVIFE